MSSGDPETRRRILKETRRLMENRRGKDVRLEDIARAAEVSRQAVYLHFGSRAGLLTATARYLDETLDHPGRTVKIFGAQDGVEALDALIEFWAGYIPDIYGLAKALFSARESDKAAASAWDDRMAAFYDKCQHIVSLLARDDLLAPEWSIKTATDYVWAVLAILTWEDLTMKRGWTQDEYVRYMQMTLKRALVKADDL